MSEAQYPRPFRHARAGATGRPTWANNPAEEAALRYRGFRPVEAPPAAPAPALPAAPALRATDTAAAERMRRSRSRRKAGERVVTVAVPAAVLERLRQAGLLAEAQQDDLEIIGAALLAAGATASLFPSEPPVPPVRLPLTSVPPHPPGRCYCHACCGLRGHYALER